MSEKVSALPAFVKHSASGVIAGAVSGIVLSVAASFIAYSADDPGSLIKPLAIAAFFISAVICGIASSKKAGKNPIAALAGGTAFVLLLTLVSFVVPGEGVEITEWILMRLGGIAAAFLGGILVSLIGGGRKKGHRRSAHKKSAHRR